MKKKVAMRICTAILASGMIAGIANDNDPSLGVDDEWGVYVLNGTDVWSLSPEYVGPVWEFKDKDIFKEIRDNPT